jgi:hypothetical protein
MTRFVQQPTLGNIHRSVGGALAEGTAYANTDVLVVPVAIYGAGGVRLRGKFTGAGSLAVAVLRWDGQTVYDTAPVTAISVTANTEFVEDIDLRGERGLRLTFTASATGVVTYLDVSAAIGIGPTPP